MKKFLFLLTGLMCMLVSCGGGEDSPNEPTPTPNPTPNEPAASITMNTNIPSGGLAFDVKGGEKSVDFTTNKDWTVTVAATTGGATWCTASPTSGKQGDATVKFTVKENTDYDDRSVSVTIKAGTASKTFTINQKGAEALLVTTTKYEVEQAGGEIEVEVQANIDYEMEISETAKSWISEATTRALTTHKHTFTIAANEEVEKREGEIVFKSGDKVETVKVYQAGGAVLVLSQNEFNVSDAGEVITIDVKSNIDFGVHMPDVDWISNEAATRGMSSHTLKYDIAPNETYDAREAEIVFYDKNSDLKETVKIVQVQKDAIIISNKSYEVKAEGETIEVKLSANVEFDVTMPDVDWITQVTTRRLTEHTLYYKVAENTGEESRSAEIVFINKDTQLKETIQITQNGAFKGSYVDGVVTIGKAGTMLELLGGSYNANKIESLKVVGPINGTDLYNLRLMLGYYIFKEENGKLSKLDLSEAVIVKGGKPYYDEFILNSHIRYNTSSDTIGNRMFENCINLRSIKLPKSVKSIESLAFRGCPLKSIIIPDNVTSIGYSAFQGCPLETITIPKSVTSIKESAFKNCYNLERLFISDLSAWCKIDFEDSDANPLNYAQELYLNGYEATDIIIPDDVTSIGNYAFCGYNTLTSVTIPNSVTSIGTSAFQACESLSSITIPTSVTSIGDYAFFQCYGIKSLYISDLSAWYKIDFGGIHANPLYNADIFYVNGEEVTDLIIPDNVTSIKDYAFCGYNTLISVTIPNSVTSIGKEAFRSCEKLTSVTIGNSLTSIGRGAFQACESLPSITIPTSVTSIGKDAFDQCHGIKSVYISDLSAWCKIDFGNGKANPLNGVDNFYVNGDEVTDLIIPDDVASIEKYTFYGCKTESVIIGNSVTSIGEYAFYGCKTESVTIGNSVTSIGKYAFSKCSATLYYSYAISPPEITMKTFDSIKNATLYIPKGCLEIYLQSYEWAEIFDTINEME